MAKGRKTGGRQKGTPNATTRQLREVIAELVEGNAVEAEHKLNEVEDPIQWLKLYQGFLEYGMPKLQRIEKGISDASDEELLSEVRRRAALKAADADPEPR